MTEIKRTFLVNIKILIFRSKWFDRLDWSKKKKIKKNLKFIDQLEKQSHKYNRNVYV